MATRYVQRESLISEVVAAVLRGSSTATDVLDAITKDGDVARVDGRKVDLSEVRAIAESAARRGLIVITFRSPGSGWTRAKLSAPVSK